MRSENTYSMALINITNPKKPYAMNKDLNGGFGTSDSYGSSITSKIISLFKKKKIRIPILSFAYIQAIFKDQGHQVKYFDDTLPKEPYNIILLYGSIVDYKYENEIAKQLKEQFPAARIGFFGPFPSRFHSFFSADFIIGGEAEEFFMNQFKDIQQLQGVVGKDAVTNFDALPTPCFDGFPINKYSYFPSLLGRPFLPLLASKGCPHSCKYYCTYGEYQGSKIRVRSVQKVVGDMKALQEKHHVRAIQFRDPLFGALPGYIEDFCEELKNQNVSIVWGMETRMDLLNEEKIKKMFAVGLRNINVGIETANKHIAEKNNRRKMNESGQEQLITFCKKMGMSISPFYILGYDGDTEETIMNTVKYAMFLNTPVARFSISTPYPGTGFYEQLKREGRILNSNLEDYTQFKLVYKHPNLTPEQMQVLLEKAIRQYYFRFGYMREALGWYIKRFLL